MGPSQVEILFRVPSFCVGNMLHSASLTFPEFQGADSNSCLSGEGGETEAKEGQSGNNLSKDELHLCLCIPVIVPL